MLEEALVRYCAPTLAGLKSGSLFNYSYLSLDYLLERIKHWNERCWEKGVRMTILSSGRGKSLVYVYRADKLKQDWASPNISEFLESVGYDPGILNNRSLYYLDELKKRALSLTKSVCF